MHVIFYETLSAELTYRQHEIFFLTERRGDIRSLYLFYYAPEPWPAQETYFFFLELRLTRLFYIYQQNINERISLIHTKKS